MTNQEAFNEAVHKRGGIFDIEKIDTESQFLFYELKDSAQTLINEIRETEYAFDIGTQNKMPEVYFDFIDSPTFNAGAISSNGREFIGVNYGAVLLILDMFNRMLSRNDIFPEIGKPEIEINPAPIPFVAGNYDIIKEFHETDSYSPVVVPKDPARRDHAALLTNFAVYFLIFHEFTHLKNGHVGYKGSKTGESFIMEFNPETKNKLPALTKKILEWDADNWAANDSIHRLMGNLGSDPEFREMFQNYEDINAGAIANWGFSIWSLFKLMDMVERKEVAGYDYPTGRQRQIATYSLASKALMGYNPDENSNSLVIDFQDITIKSENAISLICDSSTDLLYLEELFSELEKLSTKPVEEQHFDFELEFLSIWRGNIKAELMPFSRIDLFKLNSKSPNGLVPNRK